MVGRGFVTDNFGQINCFLSMNTKHINDVIVAGEITIIPTITNSVYDKTCFIPSKFSAVISFTNAKGASAFKLTGGAFILPASSASSIVPVFTLRITSEVNQIKAWLANDILALSSVVSAPLTNVAVINHSGGTFGKPEAPTLRATLRMFSFAPISTPFIIGGYRLVADGAISY